MCSLLGGESKCPPPYQGYAIIQNLIADEDLLDNNGQSVILIAPSFRNSHTWKWKCGEQCTGIVCRPKRCGGFSALLNNGVTDKGYFLQVGLYFTNRDDPVNPLLKGNHPPIPSDCVNLPEPDPGNPFSPDGVGYVVFAGAKIEEGSAKPSAHALCVPYTSGHHYYTTITYTSGTWWTCAADLQDTATYRCQEHPEATATDSTHLINHPTGTSVFVENWNKKLLTSSGHPPQLVAYEAKIYKEGIGYPWKSEAKWTQHSCNDKSWPPEQAFVGSLVTDGRPVNDGYAFFNAGYLPHYCE